MALICFCPASFSSSVRWGSRGGAAGFPDLAVEFLDLTFQAHFQVIGPAVQLVGLGLKQACIAFGDVSLDLGLAFAGCASIVEQSHPRRLFRRRPYLHPRSSPRPLPEGRSLPGRHQQTGCYFFIHRAVLWSVSAAKMRWSSAWSSDSTLNKESVKPAGLADEGFQRCHFAVVLPVVERNLGGRQLAPLLGPRGLRRVDG